MSSSPVVGAPAGPSFRWLDDKAMRLFVFRSLLWPRVAARWAGFIRDFHRSFGAREPAPRVLAKPLRSYVDARLSPARRLAILIEHYRNFAELFSRECVRRICAGETIVVAELEARKGARYCLAVAAAAKVSMQREGELAFYLFKRGQDVELSRISLAFGRIDGELAVVVAGLQGPQGGRKREVIEATRELHGLRPKDATLLAARALARELGARSVHAIADRNHVLRRLQDQSKLSHYDSYWLERGAIPGGPYGFVFAPLGAVESDGKGRSAAKAAIVDGLETFARVHSRVAAPPSCNQALPAQRLAAA